MTGFGGGVERRQPSRLNQQVVDRVVDAGVERQSDDGAAGRSGSGGGGGGGGAAQPAQQ